MDIKLLIVIGALVILVGVLFREQTRIIRPAIIAFLISLIWTSIYRYEYVGENIFLFGYSNIYPLILWTVGLTCLAFMYERRHRRNIFLMGALYIVLLFVCEWVGYHLLGIRLRSNFTGIGNLDIIHGTPVMQVFYILAGHLYLCILRYLPHQT